MPATTATTVIGSACQLIGLYAPGETPSDADGVVALHWLNNLIGSWAQTNTTIPVVAREVFTLVANQASYTIGVGGNFNTARPPNQSNVVGAALLLTTPGPPNEVEVPLGLLTDDGYANLRVKGMLSGQPKVLYYNPTYATSDFGTITLWPVPNVATNTLVLYLEKALSEFADLTTTYRFPPGYAEALELQLAKRLSLIYPKAQVPEGFERLAAESWATIQRANLKLSDLTNDLVGARGGLYDITTG